MWWIVLPVAFAGNLEIAVESEHGSLRTTLEEVALCARQTLRLEDGESTWRIAPEVVPVGEELRIELQVEHHWKQGSGTSTFETQPTVQMKNGKSAHIEVVAYDRDKHRITIQPTGFEGVPSDCSDMRRRGRAEGGAPIQGTKFQVERSAIDKFLSNDDQFLYGARMTPRRNSAGDVAGFRVAGIRRGSLLSALGIQNGDVLHAINGQTLTSMREAVTAFRSLSRLSHFTFEITHRGQKQTLEYEIR